MNNEHRIAQLGLRAWPFRRGAGRIVDTFFKDLRIAEGQATVRTTDGFKMIVNPNDLIGRHIYLTGEFDRSIVEVLCNFSEPNDILLDIGANIGYVSACFLQNVPGSHAIAIEPQESVIGILRANLPAERSTIVPYALSEQDGEAWLQTDVANTGAGRIVETGRPGSIRIRTKSAKALFAELHDISKLDLVKIDAEGHEKTIIRACLCHFEQLHPKAILFEDAGGDATSIAGQLAQIGYRTFGIRKSLMSLALVDSLQTHDCIAVSTQRQIPDRAKRAYSL